MNILDYIEKMKDMYEGPRITAQEPRTMAQGGRIGFGDGGITLVKNKSKNVVGENLRLFNQGKLYHLRIGADKKNYYGSKEKLTKIFNKRRTAGGDVMSRLEKKKYPKNWKTADQFMKWLDSKNLTIKDNPASFARNHGIKTKPNPYQKNAKIYYIGDIDKAKLDKIEKARVVTGTGTEAQKKKWRKGITYFNDLRKAWLDKFSLRWFEKSKLKGTRALHLGHASDISREYVTPRSLVMTPGTINMQYLWPIDYRIREIHNEIDKLKKNKPKDWVNKIRALNNEGKELARLSKGYKHFTEWDPITNKTKTHGIIKKMTLDPKGEFAGKTLQDLTKDERAKLVKLRNKIVENTSTKKINQQIKKFEPQVKKIISYLSRNEDLTKRLTMKLNSGLPIDDIAMIISEDLKIPLQKVGPVLGKAIKGLGVVTAPLMVLPYTEQFEKGLGGADVAKAGTVQLMEDFLNMPPALYELAKAGVKKAMGKENVLEEMDPLWEFDFGKKYSDKLTAETPVEERMENLKEIEYAKTLNIPDVMDIPPSREEILEEKEKFMGKDLPADRMEKILSVPYKPKTIDPLASIFDPIPKMEFAGGGMAGIRRPSAIPPESGPQSQGLAYLKKYGSYY